MVGTLGAGVLVRYVSSKWFLTASLVLLFTSAVVLVLSKWFPALCAARFLMGVAEAFPSVYLPVWVHEFGPLDVAAQWMAYSQLCEGKFGSIKRNRVHFIVTIIVYQLLVDNDFKQHQLRGPFASPKPRLLPNSVLSLFYPLQRPSLDQLLAT